MKRRDFVAALGALAVWPLPTRAQPSMPVVGFVGSDTPDLYAGRLRAFRLGLRVIGFEEGRNVVIEYRWAEGRNDRLAALTDDLIGRKAAVIVTPTTPSALAAKALRPKPFRSSSSWPATRFSLDWSRAWLALAATSRVRPR
jgi:putative ABC transport system substrate-binding protein